MRKVLPLPQITFRRTNNGQSALHGRVAGATGYKGCNTRSGRVLV